MKKQQYDDICYLAVKKSKYMDDVEFVSIKKQHVKEYKKFFLYKYPYGEIKEISYELAKYLLNNAEVTAIQKLTIETVK